MLINEEKIPIHQPSRQLNGYLIHFLRLFIHGLHFIQTTVKVYTCFLLEPLAFITSLHLLFVGTISLGQGKPVKSYTLDQKADFGFPRGRK